MTFITIGDDIALPVTLKKNGSVFPIDITATVRAALVDMRRTQLLAGPVVCSYAAIGSDWANSLVVVEMDSATTSAVTHTGEATLEIEVDDGGKLTFYAPLRIIKGLIV